jgi:hypothetical protein
MTKFTPKQILRKRFPSPCNTEWLATLKKGDEVLFCYGGSTDQEPSKAVVLRRGKSFIEVKPEGYSHSIWMSDDGCQRFYDCGYFMYLAPVV